MVNTILTNSNRKRKIIKFIMFVFILIFVYFSYIKILSFYNASKYHEFYDFIEEDQAQSQYALIYRDEKQISSISSNKQLIRILESGLFEEIGTKKESLEDSYAILNINSPEQTALIEMNSHYILVRKGKDRIEAAHNEGVIYRIHNIPVLEEYCFRLYQLNFKK